MSSKELIERLSSVTDEGFMGLAWAAKCRIEELERQLQELQNLIKDSYNYTQPNQGESQ